MSRTRWEEYSKAGPATPEQIARVEARVGHTFPEDFKRALREHQGMIPRPNGLRLRPDRPRKGFGALGHCVEGKSGNIARTWELMRAWVDDPYPSWLVPISTAKGQAHFALDFRASEDSPTVVYVNPDLSSDAPGFITPVASSFTDLLEMMESDPSLDR